jgi:hypothetical protein
MALIPKIIENIKRNKVLPTSDIGPVANVNGTQLFLQNRQGSNGRNIIFAKVTFTARVNSTKYTGTVYLNGPASSGSTGQTIYLMNDDDGISLVGSSCVAFQLAYTISGKTEIHWTADNANPAYIDDIIDDKIEDHIEVCSTEIDLAPQLQIYESGGSYELQVRMKKVKLVKSSALGVVTICPAAGSYGAWSGIGACPEVTDIDGGTEA